MSIALSAHAFGQDKTIQLEPITITGQPFEKYIPGSKIQKTDSLELAILGQGSLSDMLMQNTPIYIREYGNKALSTISFRGTGASHTGVFWNNINLNALTLGHSDFSAYTLYLFDDITVQYGGASSLYGSDAIGGSVHLNAEPRFGHGMQAEFRQDFGSFGNVFTGAKADVSNNGWTSKTRFFNFNLKNNFKYTITDRIGDEYEVEQQNAAMHNYAVLQEFHHKLKNNDLISIQGWYGYNYREVQPLMVTQPDEIVAEEDIFNRNLRVISNYKHFFKKGLLNINAGYLWDYQLYDNKDVIETKRLVGILQQELDLSEKSTLKFGGDIQYIIPNVHSYEEDLTELRGDAFVSFVHRPSTNWQFALNGRKAFVPYINPPIAPSLTTSYKLRTRDYLLTFRAQAERSYRIPTFNDRYWGNQGRKDLESEDGYSGELGINLASDLSDNFVFNLDLSGYYMIVDNWIAWQPAGGIWRPYNLKMVRASGIEFAGNFEFTQSWGTIQLNGQFAYNQSILLEGINEDDPSVNSQLPYTPCYRGVFNGIVLYKSYRFGIVNYYVGERNGQDVLNETVDPYFLTNLNLSKNFPLGHHQISAELQVLNIFDLSYQNVNRYAMPGRNYLLSIRYNFNKYIL
jgi:iron complex outermembrane receptor protein